MKDRTWKIIQSHLESGFYNIASSQNSAPTEASIMKIIRDLGCEPPEEFLCHSTNKYGGLYVEVKEEFWPRPKEFDVGPFWSFLYGLYTFNVAPKIPDFMDLKSRTIEFQKQTGHVAVPCLRLIANADLYCFNRQAEILCWDHETNELAKSDKSFLQLLDYELGALVDRKNQKLRERKS